MRRIWVATCLATILLVGQAAAADQAQKAEAAERKAGALEQNAAAGGSKALPSPSEMIRRTEAQAVDSGRRRARTPSWSTAYIKTFEVGEVFFYKPHGGVAK